MSTDYTLLRDWVDSYRDRLRAHMEQLRGERDHANHRGDKLQAEVERLRSALEDALLWSNSGASHAMVMIRQTLDAALNTETDG